MLQGCRLSAARQRSAPLLPMQMCDAARPQPLGQSNFVLLRNTLAHTISKRPTICRMNLLRGKLRSNGPLMCADLIFRVSDIAKLLAKTNFPQQAKYIHFSKLVRESGPWTGDTLLLKHTPLVVSSLRKLWRQLLCKTKLRVSRILGVPTELAACFT